MLSKTNRSMRILMEREWAMLPAFAIVIALWCSPAWGGGVVCVKNSPKGGALKIRDA